MPFKIFHHLRMNAALEDDTVWLEVAFEVVTAHVERETRRHAEQPFQRPGFTSTSSNCPGWRVARPGSTSNQSPPARDALSGDTPVRNFVQTAGVKAVGKDDAVIRNLVISWKIDRFVVAFNQTGIKIISKTAIEDPISCS